MGCQEVESSTSNFQWQPVRGWQGRFIQQLGQDWCSPRPLPTCCILTLAPLKSIFYDPNIYLVFFPLILIARDIIYIHTPIYIHTQKECVCNLDNSCHCFLSNLMCTKYHSMNCCIHVIFLVTSSVTYSQNWEQRSRVMLSKVRGWSG